MREQQASISLRPALRYAKRPFWKAVPPFEPEYGTKDIVRILKALARKAAIAGPILELFPAREPILLNSGRQCLFAILKAMGLRTKSRVGVPLYCCPAVSEAIVAAGHTPVFLDIDLGTYSISPQSLQRNRHNLDALVVIHLFGYPTDLEAIRGSLAGRGIPIIEDCAHALFTKSQGHFVGTQSEAAFFSFGPHKPAAIGGGGIALLNRPDAENNLRVLVGNSELNVLGEFLHTAHCGVRALLYQRPIYGAARALMLGRFPYQLKPQAEASAMSPQYRITSMRRCDEALLTKRVRQFQASLSHLSRNAQHLRAVLNDTSLALPEEPAYGEWNHFFLPIRYRDAQSRGRGREYLASQKIDAVSLYGNCVRYATGLGYSGGCPNAEKAAETVAIVPHYTSLSTEEIDFIGNSVRKSAEA